MKPVSRRIARLEARCAPVQPAYLRDPEKRLRVLVSQFGQLKLDACSCHRTLCADGSPIEVVRLNSMRDGLSDEQVDTFVESFPIERQ